MQAATGIATHPQVDSANENHYQRTLNSGLQDHIMRKRGLLAVCGITIMSIRPAWGDHKVYSPIVEEGVLEFEARGHRTLDSSAEKDNQQTQKYEVAYGVNSWWYTAIFGELNKDPQASLQYSATAWENIFQLTPQGKYWLDAGVYVEYAKSAIGGAPDELEMKLLLEKQVAPLLFTANLVFNREIGNNAGKGPWNRGKNTPVELDRMAKTAFRFPIAGVSRAAMGLLFAQTAQAEDFVLTIRRHVFEPTEIIIPVDQTVKLIVRNEEPTMEQFGSFDLNRGKVVAPGDQIEVFVGPLSRGRYEFFGDFHADTARGHIVVR